MGHNRILFNPRSRAWKSVVGTLIAGADVEYVADATLAAVEHGLKRLSNDPGLVCVLTETFNFVAGFRTKDPDNALKRSGFDLPTDRSMYSYLAALSERINDRMSAEAARTTPGEIARHSITQALNQATASSDLFGEEGASSARALKVQSSPSNFGKLMHEFFATFTHRYLNYHLAKELPQLLGRTDRLPDLQSQSTFNREFALYVRQTVRITDEFTPGWFGKANWQGRLDTQSVGRFAHVAFKKIRTDFRKGHRKDE
jgi:hypothetical protein